MPAEPRKIAIANMKGGSGKTTTAVNLSAGLAIRGARVLLVDIDPQANASLCVGVDVPRVTSTIYELLLDEEADVAKAILPTKTSGLDVLPSAPRLAGAEVELAPVPGREFRLKQTLARREKEYDFIIVDTPVSLGILNLNALVACQEVMAPVQTHHLSVVAVEQLSDIIKMVNRELNPDLKISGLIPTMMDRRMKLSAKLVEKMEHEYGKNLLRAKIRLDARLAEAPSRGKPIYLYAPKSNGAYDYQVLADDVRLM